MKVIISCLNSKYVHASLSPWCLLAGIRNFSKNNYDVSVKEGTINGDSECFANEIICENPDIVAFSCYIWNIKKTLEICRILKSRHKCKIVLGGPEVEHCPKEILEMNNFTDYVISGEGEWVFPDFLDNINDDTRIIPGLTYRKDGDIITVPAKEYTDDPPSPFTDEYINNLNGRITYIETARGCPYSCAFCLSGRYSKLRFFDLQRVKNDIILLSNSGTKTVKFVDRTFNANAERANDIFGFIKDNYGKLIPRGVCFHFEIAGDILKESTLNILAQMPCGAVQLEIGIQSFNEETLKLINRKTDINKLIKNIKTLIKFNNMHIHIDLIAGLTGENLESFINGFNTAYSLKAHMLQLGFLKLLYGAEMRENAEKYPCRFMPEPPYEIISTPWLSSESIKMLKNCEDAVDRLYNSGRFLLTLDYLTDDVGILPFDIFNKFGNFLDGNKMSLKEYAENLFNYFGEKCNKEILRERIICDLLCCSSAVQIPAVLKNTDPIYKKAKHYFINNFDKNIKIAVIRTQNKIFAVNQLEEKNLFNRYTGRYYDIDELNIL